MAQSISLYSLNMLINSNMLVSSGIILEREHPHLIFSARSKNI